MIKTFLSGSRVLEQVFELVEIDLRNAPMCSALTTAVSNCLKLLECLFAKQQTVIEFLGADQPAPLMFLEQHLLLRPTAVVQLALLVNANVDSTVSISSVRLLLALSLSSFVRSPSGNLHVTILRSSGQLGRICDGFIDRIRHTEDDINPAFSSSSDSVRLAIVDLLLCNVSQMSPNLAHVLLGFDLNVSLEQAIFENPQSVKANGQHGLLHAILSFIMDSSDAIALASTDPNGPTVLAEERRRLLERCYELVYRLCIDRKVATALLRYLRTCKDFVSKQVTLLPALAPTLSCSYLLKLAAVELHVSSQHGLRTYHTRLVGLFLGGNVSSFGHGNGASGDVPAPSSSKLVDLFHLPLEIRAWRDVASVFMLESLDLIDIRSARSVLLDILQGLSPLLADMQGPDSAATLASVLATAMTKYRQLAIREGVAARVPTELAAVFFSMVDAVLKQSCSQDARGNCYVFLLQYLRLCRAQPSKGAENVAAEALELSPQDVANLSTIQEFGELFYEVLCEDALDAEDAWKTLAFAVLESVVDLLALAGKLSTFVQWLSRKNFLNHFVGDLLRDDEKLIASLAENPGEFDFIHS